MNRYGLMAQRHWAQWLPQRYATISEPDSYFSTLGQEAAQRLGDAAGMAVGAYEDELPLDRLTAFTDGVLAIAVTIIVLEIGISSSAAHHLLPSILHHWPAYLAYLTSFLTLGVVWLQHSAITSTLRAADAS